MDKKTITFKDITSNEAINTYITAGNAALGVLGFTEHGFAHSAKAAETAAHILTVLNCREREIELAKIAGYMHDIGNMVNRIDHALTGATLAFRILDNLGMPADEIATVVSAIGNHDEGSGIAVSRVAAALILADKSDVRRSRVRRPNVDLYSDDIHDRVNYAVTYSELRFLEENTVIRLALEIDTQICPVMEFFEIFLERMLMCGRAAEFLGCRFSLEINGAVLL
ncbi:MAG: HD domain-containing protein [Clostridia bacterium]|nr:HD domain-containing protein [Clostridia bacterium]